MQDQPEHPLQPEPSTRRYTKKETAVGWGVIIAVCLIVASVVGLLHNATGGPSSAHSSTAVTATASAANSPVATSTATPAHASVALITTAAFGGPQSAWTASYGAGGDTWDVSGVGIQVEYDTGVDGKPRVYNIQVGEDTAASYWSLAQAKAYCRRFLPPDAQFKQSTTDSAGEPQDSYTSMLVARTWPANAQFGYDPSGTLTISYTPVGSTGQYIGCWVEIPS